MDAIGAADAQWIRASYSESDIGQRSLSTVHIAMHSYGFSFAGVIEAFIYETRPTAHAEYERRDDGIAVIERQPVTDAPHHWYWWKIDR